ncbi:two-component system phosphate regulon sensor histidine kinase PhoR [Ereboglobus sp. PH5-10]|uniref:sensor histidine kinase n=1 Tax=Ereboglobus sp. PH5-10 TaxID=2940629 RepID=UPI0024073023|nr:ATP-binding protein [Ereboglobus sp. PH5-10]MDF9827101.1 two-component system phosphate regulon sensor histidine kinase PhoR [Ereboglobus sp. PH5-10]
MTASTRRIFIYWLLLIISTLVVGAAALWLLGREQVHIREQASAAVAARQSAVQARTRLIAENIDLVLGDVQSGLMTTLLDAPSSNAGNYLDNWRRTNPLVHDVYYANSGGALRWGARNDSVVAWLATTPWRVSVAQPSPRQTTQSRIAAESQPAMTAAGDFHMDSPISMEQFSVTKKETNVAGASIAKGAAPVSISEGKLQNNASSYQTARVAMQSMANYNVNVAKRIDPAPPPLSAISEVEALEEIQVEKSMSVMADEKIIAPPVAADKRARATRTNSVSSAARPQAKSAESVAPVPTTSRDAAMLKSKKTDMQIPAVFDATTPPPELTGWAPWRDEAGVLHLFGWRFTTQGAVLVVEVNLEAIASRLREILPQVIEPDEAYVLFKDTGARIAQVGMNADNTAEQAYSQPLMLPGWRVAGFTVAGELGSLNTSAFLLASALLIGFFILTIIGGGSLLMRQARLSAAESAQKTSFVANVSHEFKTPLTTIRLYSELLEQGRIRDEDRRAESLQTISRETQRLARLVNNVLDFSRLEQGRKKFDLAEHDLNAELNRLLDRHAPRLAEAGIKLEREISAEPCIMKTDLDAVEQIVINLLDNACKYAANGGEVLVALRNGSSGTGDPPVGLGGMADPAMSSEHGRDARATQPITITVADRGPGIPSSHREKIFDKFHRVDDTLTASQGGSGLGLSIARQLARGLGGDLAYAPRKGGGSEFALTLRAS